MNVFVFSQNGVPLYGYTSLHEGCLIAGLPYASVRRRIIKKGKYLTNVDKDVVSVDKIVVSQIKGRGRKKL